MLVGDALLRVMDSVIFRWLCCHVRPEEEIRSEYASSPEVLEQTVVYLENPIVVERDLLEDQIFETRKALEDLETGRNKRPLTRIEAKQNEKSSQKLEKNLRELLKARAELGMCKPAPRIRHRSWWARTMYSKKRKQEFTQQKG